jgi:hypothetical protein
VIQLTAWFWIAIFVVLFSEIILAALAIWGTLSLLLLLVDGACRGSSEYRSLTPWPPPLVKRLWRFPTGGSAPAVRAPGPGPAPLAPWRIVFQLATSP